MKVCKMCGIEISTRDGDNTCANCDDMNQRKSAAKKRATINRRERDSVMRSLGLVKVRGALGGVYWE